MTFPEFCERLKSLRVDRSNGIAKPYKPILLSAVILLIHKGKITSPAIFLDGGLRSAFDQLLARLFPEWTFKANIALPFRHLVTDGVWRLVPHAGEDATLKSVLSTGGAAWDVLRHVRCAELDPDVFHRLVRKPEARIRALYILCKHYFPADGMMKLLELMEEDSPQLERDAFKPDALTERALEEHLQAHWDRTPFAEMGIELANPGRQVLTPVNAIDLLGYRSKHREWWVFELKRGRPGDAVVGQTSRYLAWIQQEHGKDGARGAIIAGHADRKLMYAVKANPLLSLWRYDNELRVEPIAC